jgi:hypothetical protein
MCTTLTYRGTFTATCCRTKDDAEEAHATRRKIRLTPILITKQMYQQEKGIKNFKLEPSDRPTSVHSKKHVRGVCTPKDVGLLGSYVRTPTTSVSTKAHRNKNCDTTPGSNTPGTCIMVPLLGEAWGMGQTVSLELFYHMNLLA